MFVYFLVFIFALLYYLSNYHQSKGIFILFMVYLAVFIGLGDMIGGFDRYIYGALFDGIADRMKAGISDWQIFNENTVRGTEYGYIIWNIFLAHVTSNRYMFIFLTTLVMYALYIRTFIQHLDKYPMACVIFLGLLFYFTITYMRQCLAVAIAWQGIKYVMNRKPIPFFLLSYLAFTIHNSAIIFFPLYFIPIRKYSKSQILLFLGVCFMLGLSPLSSMLLLSSDDFTGAQARNYGNEMSGTNVMYLLEVILFLFVLLRYYHLISSDRKSLVFLNSFIVFCATLLFFIRFDQGGRIGWYFIIGLIYTFSKIFDDKRIPMAIKSLAIFVSFVLFTRITVAWAFNLTPYKTFLTNGYPSGERRIYEDNEWDERYTKDKFFRPMIDFK